MHTVPKYMILGLRHALFPYKQQLEGFQLHDHHEHEKESSILMQHLRILKELFVPGCYQKHGGQ